jgi:four helix bundle protein
MNNVAFREKMEARTVLFAVNTLAYLRTVPYDVATKVIAFQLGKSASSIGANYHEANRAVSRDDFAHKISISLKEANESVYWFKVAKGVLGETAQLQGLLQEALELRNLFQSILSSVKGRSNSTTPNSSTLNSPVNSTTSNSTTPNSSTPNSTTSNSSTPNSSTPPL